MNFFRPVSSAKSFWTCNYFLKRRQQAVPESSQQSLLYSIYYHGPPLKSDPTRKRSFLLDPPRKPPLKRSPSPKILPKDASDFEHKMASNPYAAILATPVRRCFYSRKSLPNAFLTKLIQAAPDSQEDGVRTWIVPERIIPTEIQKDPASGASFGRAGIGKWIYSAWRIMENMVKEGKFKAINSTAFIRPDLAQLVYTQWTIRVTHDIVKFCKYDRRRRCNNILVHLAQDPSASIPYAINSQRKVDNLGFIFETPKNECLQCILYFDIIKDGIDMDRTKSRNESSDAESNMLKEQEQQLSPSLSTLDDDNDNEDDTQPKLPLKMNRSDVMIQAMIRGKNGDTSTVPLYDINKLFNNYPHGLLSIQQMCSKVLPTLGKTAISGQGGTWIGLVASSSSVPVATGLWKLVSMLPE